MIRCATTSTRTLLSLNNTAGLRSGSSASRSLSRPSCFPSRVAPHHHWSQKPRSVQFTSCTTASLFASRYVMLAPSSLSSSTSKCLISQLIRSQTRTQSSAVSTKAIAEKTTKNKSKFSEYLKRLAKTIKFIRVPFLVLSVYSIGYRQGLVDFSRNPEKHKSEILAGLAQSVGCDNLQKVEVVFEDDWETKISKGKLTKIDDTSNDRQALLRRVAFVAEKIVKIAKKHTRQELQDCVNQHIAAAQKEYEKDHGKKPSQESFEEMESRLAKKLKKDTEEKGYEFWVKANERMGTFLYYDDKRNRMSENTKKWNFFLIDTPVANAFVSEAMPQSIFITTGMLHQFIDNDDELALVLGHEVSHLILGHNSDSNQFNLFLRALEILLLSFDPTEGAVASLMFMFIIRFVSNAVAATHSRGNETEADCLGIKLAAMGCFDTRRAPIVFRKMAEQHVEELHPPEKTNMTIDNSSDIATNLTTSFMNTHPPSLERHAYLESMSLEENREKYADTHCPDYKRKFFTSLRLSKS